MLLVEFYEMAFHVIVQLFLGVYSVQDCVSDPVSVEVKGIDFGVLVKGYLVIVAFLLRQLHTITSSLRIANSHTIHPTESPLAICMIDPA